MKSSLVAEFGDLQRLLRASVGELDQVGGVGRARAQQLRHYFRPPPGGQPELGPGGGLEPGDRTRGTVRRPQTRGGAWPWTRRPPQARRDPSKEGRGSGFHEDTRQDTCEGCHHAPGEKAAAQGSAAAATQPSRRQAGGEGGAEEAQGGRCCARQGARPEGGGAETRRGPGGAAGDPGTAAGRRRPPVAQAVPKTASDEGGRPKPAPKKRRAEGRPPREPEAALKKAAAPKPAPKKPEPKPAPKKPEPKKPEPKKERTPPPPPSPFTVGDKVVYPHHGAAVQSPAR